MNGVVVDTSLWIPSIRGSKEHQRVIREFEFAQRIYMVSPIEMELRAGATARQLPMLEVLLDAIPAVPLIERVDFKRAGEIFRSCRERGLGVRSLVDCLVSAVVERHEGLVIAHNDRDFDWIAEVSGITAERVQLDA